MTDEIDIKPNLLDRAISYVSPKRGAARVRERMQLAIINSFAGADDSRRALTNWIPKVASPDLDMVWDLRRLRLRSRDLARNSPLAIGAINTSVTNVIGSGLTVHSRVDAEVLGISDDEAENLQRLIEREFALWAEHPQSCDAAGTLDFYGLQELAFRSAMESGDVFALLPMISRKGTVYDTKVQLIEADRISNPQMQMDTAKCAMGVEVDDFGKPVKYYIQTTHPGTIGPVEYKWDAVNVFGSRTGRRNVVHLYKMLRPGQRRGLPFLTPVIESLKQLSRYTDAEITAAVVSSMFAVFVTTEGGVGLDAGFNPIPGTTGNGGPMQDNQAGGNIQLESGAIIDLAPGEKIDTANPGRPNTAFDPFVQAILRQIGVALEIPFEILIKHFSSSYSASRAALLEAWRYFKNRRVWVALQFCQPVYEAWFEEAVAAGRIPAPGFFDDPVMRAAYLKSEWTGDSQGQIDPDKEISAAERRIALTVSDYATEMTDLNGRDWYTNVKKLERQRKQLMDAGISIPLPPGQQADPLQGGAADPNEGNEPNEPAQKQEPGKPAPGKQPPAKPKGKQ